MYILKEVHNTCKTYKTFEEAETKAKEMALDDAYDGYANGVIVAKVETYVKAIVPIVPVEAVSIELLLSKKEEIKELN